MNPSAPYPSYRDLLDLMTAEHPVALDEVGTPGALNRQPAGFGMETMYGDGIALTGGMRSGNSPPGLLRRMYTIIDVEAFKANGGNPNAASLGFAEVMTDAQDDIRALINIKLTKSKTEDKRRQGTGSAVVQSLLMSAPGDLVIMDIQKPAIGFWRKMGCEFYSVNGVAVPKPGEFKVAGTTLMGIIRQPGSDSSTPPREMPGFRGWRG